MQWVDDPATHPPVEPLGKEPITEDMVISFSVVADRAVDSPSQMQFPGFHKILSWFKHVHAPDTVTPLWVTWYELMWSFQRYTGFRELQKVNCHSKWKLGSEKFAYDCTRACRSFAAYMTHIIRVAYPDFQTVWLSLAITDGRCGDAACPSGGTHLIELQCWIGWASNLAPNKFIRQRQIWVPHRQRMWG